VVDRCVDQGRRRRFLEAEIEVFPAHLLRFFAHILLELFPQGVVAFRNLQQDDNVVVIGCVEKRLDTDVIGRHQSRGEFAAVGVGLASNVRTGGENAGDLNQKLPDVTTVELHLGAVEADRITARAFIRYGDIHRQSPSVACPFEGPGIKAGTGWFSRQDSGLDRAVGCAIIIAIMLDLSPSYLTGIRRIIDPAS